MQLEEDPIFSFSLLPDDIFSHHILKLFDFRAWLRLVIVCKQWYLAAQRSHLPQQLIVKELHIKPALSILAKYHITTLVVDKDVRFELIKQMLETSLSITTLVAGAQAPDDEQEAEQFTQITTLAADNCSLLECFPNVTRFKVTSPFNSQLNFVTRPQIKELEINIETNDHSDWRYLDRLRTLFPSLVKLYVLCRNYSVKEWERLEQFGETLGVQVICRYHHVSERSDTFSFKTIKYHEYFNAFGETPLQHLLRYGYRDKESQELFVSYLGKQYEKDLFLCQPQFTFPLLGPNFVRVASRTPSLGLGGRMLEAMVECGYLDYWKALGFFLSRNRNCFCHTTKCDHKKRAILGRVLAIG